MPIIIDDLAGIPGIVTGKQNQDDSTLHVWRSKPQLTPKSPRAVLRQIRDKRDQGDCNLVTYSKQRADSTSKQRADSTVQATNRINIHDTFIEEHTREVVALIEYANKTRSERLDKALTQSFPASDPPSFNPGTATAKED